jgi:hypothetical protein
MTTVVTTIIKSEKDPWIFSTGEGRISWFSINEITEILDPFEVFVSRLPGYIESGFSSSISENIAIFTRAFDTRDNASNYLEILKASNAPEVVVLRNRLLYNTYKKYGVTYNISHKIND